MKIDAAGILEDAQVEFGKDREQVIDDVGLLEAQRCVLRAAEGGTRKLIAATGLTPSQLLVLGEIDVPRSSIGLSRSASQPEPAMTRTSGGCCRAIWTVVASAWRLRRISQRTIAAREVRRRKLSNSDQIVAC
ncbi:hypothetical protein TPR58_02040 [Sphingomonas sp. HF-S3]|uniref:Uncharacterized protein n=1 Tax=Sphingomonas rustica TaxID=3103142 RepID=A0ABV0B5X1_9SPHN